jgi:hypothetical protein
LLVKNVAYRRIGYFLFHVKKYSYFFMLYFSFR